VTAGHGTGASDDENAVPSVPPGATEESGRAAIEMMTGWINNADQKGAVLGAALVVYGAALAHQRDTVAGTVDKVAHHAYRHHHDARDVVSLVRDYLSLMLFVAAVLALLYAGSRLLGVLSPRIEDPQQPGPTQPVPSRFSWPFVAGADLTRLTGGTPTQIRDEAWLHAQTLAVIAAAKFRCFRQGLGGATLSLVFAALWVTVRA